MIETRKKNNQEGIVYLLLLKVDILKSSIIPFNLEVLI